MGRTDWPAEGQQMNPLVRPTWPSPMPPERSMDSTIKHETSKPDRLAPISDQTEFVVYRLTVMSSLHFLNYASTPPKRIMHSFQTMPGPFIKGTPADFIWEDVQLSGDMQHRPLDKSLRDVFPELLAPRPPANLSVQLRNALRTLRMCYHQQPQDSANIDYAIFQMFNTPQSITHGCLQLLKDILRESNIPTKHKILKMLEEPFYERFIAWRVQRPHCDPIYIQVYVELDGIVDPETIFYCFLNMRINTPGLDRILDKLNQFGRDTDHFEDYAGCHEEIVAHLVHIFHWSQPTILDDQDLLLLCFYILQHDDTYELCGLEEYFDQARQKIRKKNKVPIRTELRQLIEEVAQRYEDAVSNRN